MCQCKGYDNMPITNVAIDTKIGYIKCKKLNLTFLKGWSSINNHCFIVRLTN